MMIDNVIAAVSRLTRVVDGSLDTHPELREDIRVLLEYMRYQQAVMLRVERMLNNLYETEEKAINLAGSALSFLEETIKGNVVLA